MKLQLQNQADDEFVSLSLIDEDGLLTINLDQKNYAHFDMKLFKKTPIDTVDII